MVVVLTSNLNSIPISLLLSEKCFSILDNKAFNRGTALQVITAGEADAISFGKDFISNPDLVSLLQRNLTLNPYDTDTFYGYGLRDPKVGYIDYFFWESPAI